MRQIETGFLQTAFIGLLVVLFALLWSWIIVNLQNIFHSQRSGILLLILNFLINLIRSVPQIVGILFGYIGITVLIRGELPDKNWIIILLMAFVISVFIFLELVDLMQERINHFKKSDFYNAMLVCGISERRIINFDILWKNSRIHIFNKLIALLGIAVFLQCSIDFIISVGLSTEVSSVDLPVTLGSLLAQMDSKQDILAIGNTLTHPAYVFNLFFKHLQGITVAFLIVFSLFSIFKISNGFAERYRI